MLPAVVLCTGAVATQNTFFEATLNGGSKELAAALSVQHLHGIGSGKQRFKIGYGLRLTAFFADEPDYVTAPAKFTSGKESIAALFTSNIEANFDTVTFAKAQVYALNAGIYLQYTPPLLNDKLDIGFNIDAIGISFGQKQGGTIPTGGIFASTVSGPPTRFNLLLISDSDRGSLNSEYFLRYHFSSRWAIKVGYEFLFTEYTVSRADGTAVQRIGTETNDRFRLKSSLFLLGLSFSPW